MTTAGLVYVKGENDSIIGIFHIQPDGYPSWVIPGLEAIMKGLKNPYWRVKAIRDAMESKTTEMRITELRVANLENIKRNETSFNYIYIVGVRGGIVPYHVEAIFSKPVSELKKRFKSKTKPLRPEEIEIVDYKVVKVTKSKDKDSIRYW